MSACVLAHVNTSGQNIPLWLDSDAPSLGWGRSTSHPLQEGSFFGNIFTSPPKAYYCNSKDFDYGVVPDRLGAQAGSPYQNPFGSNGRVPRRAPPPTLPTTTTATRPAPPRALRNARRLNR